MTFTLLIYRNSFYLGWLLLVLANTLCGCGQRDGKRVQVEQGMLDAYAGEYLPSADTVVTVARADGHLEFQINNGFPMTFIPVTKERFVHLASGTKITFGRDDTGAVTHLVLDRGGKKSEAKRVTTPPTGGQPQAAATGGQGFRFRITGNGQPTVILWGGIDPWRKVQQGVAVFARVTSFDRAKANASAAVPRLPSEAARELHAALTSGDLPPPYLLVSHSFGGALARVFASLYPKDVAGLVLVDPFQEGFVDWLKVHQPENHSKFVGELGRAYVSDWDGTLAELGAASLSPDLPVVLLSVTRRKAQTGNSFEQGISAAALAEGSDAVVAAHREWLARIPRGRQVTVEGGSHDIPGEHPEIVVEAIQRLVEQISFPRQ